MEGTRCALVTGAGIGIGRGIALSLAREGYDIALHCCHSRDRAQDVKRMIGALGRRCELLQADTRHVEEVRRLFDEYGRLFPSLDVFVANAGVTRKKPFLEMDEETFDEVTDLDYKGTYFCVQAAGRMMSGNGTRGSIVIISSNNALMQTPGVTCYGSVKEALMHLTRHSAMELARYGIRVNCVAPGWTDTGEARLPAPETTYARIPLKRWAKPEEIGRAVCFLCGEYATSVTGSCLVMDGGASLMTAPAQDYGL